MIRNSVVRNHILNHALKYTSGFLVAVCFLIYYPGSAGGFIYDDIPNIVSNPDIGTLSLQGKDILRAALSSFSGPLRRPVSMLSFAINYRFAGLDPYTYKLTNIAIHLLNGVLIGLLAYLVLKQIGQGRHGGDADHKIISLAVSAFWLLHPINLTTVLYIVQRMNGLAAMFTLMGLCLYIEGRARMNGHDGGKVHVLAAFFICGPLAILSKENGALFFVYVLLTEALLFERTVLNRMDKSYVYGLLTIFILLPALAATITVVGNPQLILDGYVHKDFTLTERLLTESRVIWFYVYLIILPNIQLMSLHHDSISLSRGILEPVSTLLSIAGLTAVVIFSIRCRKKFPLVVFGSLFFLAGHSLESTFLPLIIAFEHRNYVPAFGLIILICSICLNQSVFPKTLAARRLFLVLFVVILAFGTNTRARQWGNTELLRFYELRHNPDSAQVNYEAGRFYASSLDTDYVNDRNIVYDKAEYYFSRVLEVQPHNIEALVGLLILKVSNKNIVDYALFSRLYDVLENSRISSTGIGAIKGLLTCQRMGECEFPDNTIELMVDSINRNSSLNRRKAELMYSNISRYYRDIDMPRALEMAEKALLMNNASLDMRLYIIRLLIDMQRFNEAKTGIIEFRKFDHIGLYAGTINRLEMAISAD